jgi:TM2 domain-containing membrane protein YozV
MFCPSCGTEIFNPDAVVCLNCGGAIKQNIIVVQSKSPVLAAILSFLVCGLGQWYNGQFGKGVIYLIIALVCGSTMAIGIGFLLAPLWWVFSIADAYITAGKINRGEPADGFLNLRE